MIRLPIAHPLRSHTKVRWIAGRATLTTAVNESHAGSENIAASIRFSASAANIPDRAASSQGILMMNIQWPTRPLVAHGSNRNFQKLGTWKFGSGVWVGCRQVLHRFDLASTRCTARHTAVGSKFAVRDVRNASLRSRFFVAHRRAWIASVRSYDQPGLRAKCPYKSPCRWARPQILYSVARLRDQAEETLLPHRGPRGDRAGHLVPNLRTRIARGTSKQILNREPQASTRRGLRFPGPDRHSFPANLRKNELDGPTAIPGQNSPHPAEFRTIRSRQ